MCRPSRNKRPTCPSWQLGLVAETKVPWRAHLKNRSSSTNEPLNIRSATTVSILSFSFLHLTKKEEDITAHRTMRNLRSKEFLRSSAHLPLKFHSSLIYRGEGSPSVNRSKFQSTKRRRATRSGAYTCRDGSDPNCRSWYATPTLSAATLRKVTVTWLMRRQIGRAFKTLPACRGTTLKTKTEAIQATWG